MVINNVNEMYDAIAQLNNWTAAYDKGQPVVSDLEWDNLYFELERAEKELNVILPNSPTHKISYTVVNELKKIKHFKDCPMLSLDKTKSEDDLKNKFSNKKWIAMPKCDGLSCRLIYQHGELIQASTRGNGEEGEDITHNTRNIVPQHIPHRGKLIIDGEVVCLDKDFEEFNKEYANSRNFAAGSIRLLDSAESAKRKLSFIAWDCIIDSEHNFDTLSYQLFYLRNLGFDIASYYRADNIEEISVAIERIKKDSKEFGLPIDGVVFKLDNKQEYKNAGMTAHHPSGALAYKFYDETVETVLLDIEWQVGRSGVITPVAVYREIELEGTTCSRASLHNLNILNETLGIPYRGQKIWVAKKNQIIPQIVQAQKKQLADSSSELILPKICPICGAITEIITSDSGTTELYCTNKQCGGRSIEAFDHFCGKSGLDIKGLSATTLEKLLDWGWVQKISDIFELNKFEREWSRKPGFGEKSVNKILDAIEASRHTTLEAYICALGIPLIGRTYARELAREFKDYKSFRDGIKNKFNFSKINGFGAEKHISIIKFDYTEADKLVEDGIITFREETDNSAVAANASLGGKIFVVTGKLAYYKNREALKADIAAHGGRVVDAISAKVNYLINNDITSKSIKNQKAKALNIPIITEEELIKIF